MRFSAQATLPRPASPIAPTPERAATTVSATHAAADRSCTAYIAFVPVNHNVSSGQMDPTPFYKFIYDTNRWVMPTAPLVRIKFSFQILTTNNQPANVARDEQFALGQLTARTGPP